MAKDSDIEVCPYFISGDCKFGSNCWFRHPVDGKIPVKDDQDCCICFTSVKGTDKQFGLMLGCPHVFCLPCIREWRGQHRVTKDVSRSCPICRVPSHYVVPSIDFPTTYEEKAVIIENYKSTLKNIPCRNFNFGEGDCPFGSSCFYDHRYRNGQVWNPPPPRFILDEEGVWTVEKPTKLADLLENLL
mmetsp:Transcript_6544/g.11467  ORF Transcript_6544/g.11467 Transcript_6544/m.11467 type:complete len:187 (-) Transcript_6544:30-590(-)